MIDLTDKKPYGVGAFGAYYKLEDGTGIKVLSMYPCEGAKTPDELKNWGIWQTAHEELNCLCSLEESGLTPRGLGVEVVKKRNGYLVGIRMEHIEHSPYHKWYDITYSRACRVERALNLRLHSKTGYFHGDLHLGNIIVTGGNGKPVRLKMIDMGNRFVKPRAEKEVQYEVERLTCK